MKGIEFDSRIFVKFSIKFSYWFLPLGIIWTIFDIIFGISITSLIIQFILFIILLIFIIVITEKEVKKLSNNNKKDDLTLTKTTMIFISLFLVYF